MLDNIFRSEVVLNQFRTHSSCTQWVAAMATCGTFTTRLAMAYVSTETRVEHDKGIADESGFNGAFSAGYRRRLGHERVLRGHRPPGES